MLDYFKILDIQIDKKKDTVPLILWPCDIYGCMQFTISYMKPDFY